MAEGVNSENGRINIRKNTDNDNVGRIPRRRRGRGRRWLSGGGLALCEEDVQRYLDRRKPGQSRFTTKRSESDTVEILSGVFEGRTTGTPISMLVRNQDQHSKDTVRSPVITVPDMRIIPSMKNTVSGITGAADVLRDARRSDAWQQALSRQSCWNP